MEVAALLTLHVQIPLGLIHAHVFQDMLEMDTHALVDSQFHSVLVLVLCFLHFLKFLVGWLVVIVAILCSEISEAEATFPSVLPNRASVGVCAEGFVGTPSKQCLSNGTWESGFENSCQGIF